ncbi:unnamed protein product [Gongylonema pulchrum]|uniref:RING-type E3 ubiquitin transferase n=1 Tax=Gongylonema pulchrum TaxID=637853 RepID=A0A183DMB7_9BILA|nr:unnamed protein product [Gongylonema pulchrum]
MEGELKSKQHQANEALQSMQKHELHRGKLQKRLNEARLDDDVDSQLTEVVCLICLSRRFCVLFYMCKC